MSELATITRSVCMRETDDNLYIAVSKPYQPYDPTYEELMSITEHGQVKTLKNEGSQVFVHPIDEVPREKGSKANSQDQLSAYVIFSLSKVIRNSNPILIDPIIYRVEDKLPPMPYIKF